MKNTCYLIPSRGETKVSPPIILKESLQSLIIQRRKANEVFKRVND